MNTPRWMKDAYRDTEVHYTKSQAKIVDMLASLGIEQTRFSSLTDRFILEFVVTEEKAIPKGVRIVVPLVTMASDAPKRLKELNTVHRILLNHLKAKFISVGAKLTEFEQEFLAHLIVKGKDGRDTTIGEQLLPQYHKHIEGDGGPLLLS